MAFEASLVKPFLTGPLLTRPSAEYSQFSPDVVFLFFLPFGLASVSSLFKVYPVSLESTYASISRPGADLLQDPLVVSVQCGIQVFHRNIIREDGATERAWDSSTQLAIRRPKDSFSSLFKNSFVELVVVH
jgi:hypothetical protein